MSQGGCDVSFAEKGAIDLVMATRKGLYGLFKDV
jgi:hypothetical protein